jgi:hypothetical protein
METHAHYTSKKKRAAIPTVVRNTILYGTHDVSVEVLQVDGPLTTKKKSSDK